MPNFDLQKKLNKISNVKLRTLISRTLTSFIILIVVIIILVFSLLSSAVVYEDNSNSTWININLNVKAFLASVLLLIIGGLSLLGLKETFKILNINDFHKYNDKKFYLFCLIHYSIGFIPSIFILFYVYYLQNYHLNKTFFVVLYFLTSTAVLIYYLTIYFFYLKKVNCTPIKTERNIFIIIQILSVVFWNALYYVNVINSWVTLFLLIVLATTNDSFAYIFGTLFGKRKIFTQISPNKTIVGFITGFFTSIIISYCLLILIASTKSDPLQSQILNGVWYTNFILVSTLFNKSFLWWIFVFILFAALTLISSAGDLFFSYIKRCLKIKDYSNLLRSHGGLFDRLDSIIFITIFFFVFNLFGNMVYFNN